MAVATAVLARRWCLLAVLVVAVRPTHAGVFDLALGSDDVSHAWVPRPERGMLTTDDEALQARPRVDHEYRSGPRLRWWRGGRLDGAADSSADLWRVSARVAGARLQAELWRERDAIDQGRTTHDTSASARLPQASLRLVCPVTPRWRLAAGYDYQRWQFEALSSSPKLQPTSDGVFALDQRRQRCWLGVGGDIGDLSLALNGAWRDHRGSLSTHLRHMLGTVGLGGPGYEIAAVVGVRAGAGWCVRLGAGYTNVRSHAGIRLDGVRHGRSSPYETEFRWSAEAQGAVSSSLDWWGAVYHRRFHFGDAGGATALAPPLGSLIGPYYRVSADLDLMMTGLGSGLSWRADRRSQLSTAINLGVGHAVGGYGAWERNGSKPEKLISTSSVDQGLLLLGLSLSGEQRLGTVTVGAGTFAPVLLPHNRRARPSGGGAGGQGSRIAVGVPFRVWVSVPW